MITIKELAAKIQRPPRSLTRVAASLGFSRAGKAWELTEEQAEQVAATIRNGPGCPDFGKKYRGGKRHDD